MTGAKAKVAPLRTPRRRLLSGRAPPAAATGRGGGATASHAPLGEPAFVEELEIKFQVRLRPLPPGPPAKNRRRGRRSFPLRSGVRRGLDAGCRKVGGADLPTTCR